MYVLNFGWLPNAVVPLAIGGLYTLLLALGSCIVGASIGIVVGLGRERGGRLIGFFSASYVEVIRNTPLLVQALLIYLGLASLGFRLEPFPAALLALTINCGAYSAEIFRAGFASINRAQHEAAESLALSHWDIFAHVLLPQALRKIWVPLSGQFVLIMLASSIVSQISAEELTAAANQIQSENFRSLEVYVVLAGIYLVLSIVMKSAMFGLGRAMFRDVAAMARPSTKPRPGRA